MFLFRLTITTIILATLSNVAFSTEIRGRLVDKLSKEPIAGAEFLATADGLELRESTDAEGRFVLNLPDPPPFSMRLRVTSEGHETLDLNLTDLEHTVELSLQAEPTVFRGEVEVTGLHATLGETPVTMTNIGREEIERRYWAQDVPIFLEQTPGFYAYNDSGNGIGYSYFFLRSFDMRRTAISLNGVPLNDAHSHGVFFIDLADFLSTTDEIQVQRGVGTNLYGGSAIGGSIDLRTAMEQQRRPDRLRLLERGFVSGKAR